MDIKVLFLVVIVIIPLFGYPSFVYSETEKKSKSKVSRVGWFLLDKLPLGLGCKHVINPKKDGYRTFRNEEGEIKKRKSDKSLTNDEWGALCCRAGKGGTKSLLASIKGKGS